MSKNDWSNHMGPLCLAALIVALFLCVALAHIVTSFSRRKSKLKVRSLSSPDPRVKQKQKSLCKIFSSTPSSPKNGGAQAKTFLQTSIQPPICRQNQNQSVICQILKSYTIYGTASVTMQGKKMKKYENVLYWGQSHIHNSISMTKGRATDLA